MQADGPPRMVKRPTGSDGEPSSPNCGASAGGKARQPCSRFPFVVNNLREIKELQVSTVELNCRTTHSHDLGKRHGKHCSRTEPARLTLVRSNRHPARASWGLRQAPHQHGVGHQRPTKSHYSRDDQAEWLADFEVKRRVLKPEPLAVISPELSQELALRVRARVLRQDDGLPNLGGR